MRESQCATHIVVQLSSQLWQQLLCLCCLLRGELGLVAEAIVRLPLQDLPPAAQHSTARPVATTTFGMQAY